MEREIVNRVAKSSLITIDLEEFYPVGKRMQLDISQWLDQGLVLREKEFRASLEVFDFTHYQDTYVALGCSTGALLPAWAALLVTTRLQPYVKKVVWGSLRELEITLFQDLITSLDTSLYYDKAVIVKGCSEKNIPEAAFVALVAKLQPHVKRLMFGEACSSVPLFKR